MNELLDRVSGELTLPPVKPAHEALSELLRRHILLGTFPVGAKLPAERDLAPALGVSRNTARQALKTLADEGLVHTSLGRNGGSVVTVPQATSRNRKSVIQRWQTMMADNYEVRLATAPLAARWAAERATPQQRRAIVRLGATRSSGLGDYHALETRWQLLVASAARNELLVEVLSRSREQVFAEVFGITARAALDKSTTDWSEKFSAFATNHHEASAAIFARDPSAAEAAMVSLLERSVRTFTALAADIAESN